MGWKNLKLWKKLGIIFFFTHLIIALIISTFYFHGDGYISALILELPTLVIASIFSPSGWLERVIFYGIYDGTIFSKIYFSLINSIFYGIYGATIGLVIELIVKIKRNNSRIFKNLIK